MGAKDNHYLREFCRARDGGDEGAAGHWWRELLAINVDRVRGLVKAESRGRMSHDEVEEAVQNAMIRIDGPLRRNFDGHTMGQWHNSLQTLIHFECIDTVRGEMRAKRDQEALEASRPGGDDGGREDRILFERYQEQRSHEDADERQGELTAMGVEFLDWARGKLKGKLAEFLDMEREGLTIERMIERTGSKRDALYKQRQRLLERLAELRKEWEA